MIATKQKSLSKFRFDKDEHAYWLLRDGQESPLIGTTTILSILDKPLAYWASGMAVGELGWLNPKKATKEDRLIAAGVKLTDIKLMDIKTYLALLDKAYSAHNTSKNKARDKGVDLHGLLEDFINAEIKQQVLLFIDPLIQPFVDWAKKNVKRFLFSELCTYSESLFTAGTADFGYVDMEGNYVLGDFKSSEKAYWGMWVQLGGYHLQIAESGLYTPEGTRMFKPMEFKYHAIFAARAGLDRPFFNHDTDKMRRAFACCVQLYKEKLFWEKEQEAQ